MLISYMMFAMPRKSVRFGGLSGLVVLHVIASIKGLTLSKESTTEGG
jgi:hypothetical protein